MAAVALAAVFGVFRVAKQYMDMNRLQVVAIGDATQLEPLLSPLGATTVVR